MRFFVIISLFLSSQALSNGYPFYFYQKNLPVKFVEGHGDSANSYQEDMKVTYAYKGSRFILSVGNVWLFYGELAKEREETSSGYRVKLYDLYSESGNGKCHHGRRDGCTLGFKWSGRRKENTEGHMLIYTNFLDDDTLELKFDITRHLSTDDQEKINLTGKLEKLDSASEICTLPSPNADLQAWIDYCSSLM